MYTFSKCKVKHLLLSMCALPPIRLVRPLALRTLWREECARAAKTVHPLAAIQKAPTVIYTAGASEK